MKIAVNVLLETEQDTAATLDTVAHVTELGTVISLGKVKTILSVEYIGNGEVTVKV